MTYRESRLFTHAVRMKTTSQEKLKYMIPIHVKAKINKTKHKAIYRRAQSYLENVGIFLCNYITAVHLKRNFIYKPGLKLFCDLPNTIMKIFWFNIPKDTVVTVSKKQKKQHL